MFGHLPELAIIAVIALIVFGPEKLPEVAANAGKMVREFRQAMDQVLNPEDQHVEDFSTYYYESLARTGEVPASEAGTDPFEGWPGVAGPEALDAESVSSEALFEQGHESGVVEEVGGSHPISEGANGRLPTQTPHSSDAGSGTES